jgi:hypothetical protein
MQLIMGVLCRQVRATVRRRELTGMLRLWTVACRSPGADPAQVATTVRPLADLKAIKKKF